MVFLDGASLGQVTPMRVGGCLSVRTHWSCGWGRVLCRPSRWKRASRWILKFSLPPEPTSKLAEPVVKRARKDSLLRRKNQKSSRKSSRLRRKARKTASCAKRAGKTAGCAKDPERHIAPAHPSAHAAADSSAPGGAATGGNFGFCGSIQTVDQDICRRSGHQPKHAADRDSDDARDAPDHAV